MPVKRLLNAPFFKAKEPPSIIAPLPGCLVNPYMMQFPVDFSGVIVVNVCFDSRNIPCRLTIENGEITEVLMLAGIDSRLVAMFPGVPVTDIYGKKYVSEREIWRYIMENKDLFAPDRIVLAPAYDKPEKHSIVEPSDGVEYPSIVNDIDIEIPYLSPYSSKDTLAPGDVIDFGENEGGGKWLISHIHSGQSFVRIIDYYDENGRTQPQYHSFQDFTGQYYHDYVEPDYNQVPVSWGANGGSYGISLIPDNACGSISYQSVIDEGLLLSYQKKYDVVNNWSFNAFGKCSREKKETEIITSFWRDVLRRENILIGFKEYERFDSLSGVLYGSEAYNVLIYAVLLEDTYASCLTSKPLISSFHPAVSAPVLGWGFAPIAGILAGGIMANLLGIIRTNFKQEE